MTPERWEPDAAGRRTSHSSSPPARIRSPRRLNVGVRARPQVANIRIIACPPGEAPQAVREAWIGLELPLPLGLMRRLLFPAEVCQECK